MGWIGTGFGGLTDSLPLLLVLPVQIFALYSFRIASIGLGALLTIHLLLPFRFGLRSLTWSDLAPARIDPFFWAVVIFMGGAAWISGRSRNQAAARDKR
jgi:hypothetical protein